MSKGARTPSARVHGRGSRGIPNEARSKVRVMFFSDFRAKNTELHRTEEVRRRKDLWLLCGAVGGGLSSPAPRSRLRKSWGGVHRPGAAGSATLHRYREAFPAPASSPKASR